MSRSRFRSARLRAQSDPAATGLGSLAAPTCATPSTGRWSAAPLACRIARSACRRRTCCATPLGRAAGGGGPRPWWSILVTPRLRGIESESRHGRMLGPGGHLAQVARRCQWAVGHLDQGRQRG